MTARPSHLAKAVHFSRKGHESGHEFAKSPREALRLRRDPDKKMRLDCFFAVRRIILIWGGFIFEHVRFRRRPRAFQPRLR